ASCAERRHHPPDASCLPSRPPQGDREGDAEAAGGISETACLAGASRDETDEQIERSIEVIKDILAKREAGANAKVIEEVEPVRTRKPRGPRKSFCAPVGRPRPARPRPGGEGTLRPSCVSLSSGVSKPRMTSGLRMPLLAGHWRAPSSDFAVRPG